MVILLSGATGFVGKFVQELVPGCLPLLDHDEFVDVRDSWKLSNVVNRVKPDAVIHLAAQSFVPTSFQQPSETYEINFLGTLNLLRVLKDSGFTGRFLFVGSGEVYGLVPEDRLPVTEDQPLHPLSPYAVSKVAAEALAYQWSQTESMQIVMTRSFNHVGPGQGERFVISDLSRQIVQIKLGQREAVVEAGNVDVTRDFTHVRDVVRAYALLLQHGRTGSIYNVCSGKEYCIRHLVGVMAGIAGVKAQIQPQPARFRPLQQVRMYGSYARLHQDTGWEPTIPIEQALADTLGYWERQLA